MGAGSREQNLAQRLLTLTTRVSLSFALPIAAAARIMARMGAGSLGEQGLGAGVWPEACGSRAGS